MPYKNKADQDARNRRYYEAHKDALKAYAKEWFLEHAETQTAKIKAWRKANPEKVRKYTAAWKKRNLERVRAAEAKRKRAKRRKDRDGIVKSSPSEVAARLVAKAEKKSKQAKYGISGAFNVERR
jgi:hypothetical protein